MRSIIRTALLAGACIIAPVAVLPAAAAGASMGSARPAVAPGSGWARFGHFAPSAAPVDVYVDGATVASGVAFKGVSDYDALAAGAHQFDIKPAAQPNAPSVLTVVVDVPDGGAITVGAVTTRDGLAAQVYDDALAPPPAGSSLVRFIHSAPDFPTVDVAVVGGATIATQVAYPAATPYLPIAAGTYDLEVRENGTDKLLLKITGWSIQPGGQATVAIVRGLDGQLDVVPIADAAMSALAPVGGVQTGYGGMSWLTDGSGSSAPSPWVPIGVAVFAVAAIGAGVIARRRSATTSA